LLLDISSLLGYFNLVPELLAVEEQMKAAVAGWGRELLAARHLAAESTNRQCSLAEHSSCSDYGNGNGLDSAYGQSSSSSFVSAPAEAAAKGGDSAAYGGEQDNKTLCAGTSSCIEQCGMPFLEHLEALRSAATVARALMQQVRHVDVNGSFLARWNHINN
jgi:hypothetical protein